MNPPQNPKRSQRPVAVSVRTVDELIAYLPYSVGYHPSGDLIVCGLIDNQLHVTARLPLLAGPAKAAPCVDGDCVDGDLDGGEGSTDDEDELPVEEGDLLLTPHDIDTAVGGLVAAFERNGVSGVHAFAFETTRGDGTVVVEALRNRLECSPITLRGLHVVRHGRRWSPLSPDVRERVDGIPLADHADSPAVFAGLLGGRSPLASRQAVAELMAEDTSLSAPVSAALTDSGTRRGRAPRLWRRALLGGGTRRAGTGSPEVEEVAATTELEADQVADLLASLADVAWRDGLIAWAAHGALPFDALEPRIRRTLRTHFPARPEDPRAVLGRLMALARRAPASHPEAVAAICAVVGCVAWHLGEGSTARDAHERALAALPTYRLSQLGLHVVELGLRRDVPGPGHALGASCDTAV